MVINEKFKDSDYIKTQKNFIRNLETLDNFPKIKGYDFEEEFNFYEFIESFATTGIQASNLAKAIDIVNKMIDEKATIFLPFTANMVSSGLREIIKFLVKHKMVHCLVTTSGGIEEDVIKTMKPFVLGSFDASGRTLFENSIGRIGNIFAPMDRYLYLEKFLNPFFDRIYKMQKDNKPLVVSDMLYELGKEVQKNEYYDDSILYWAWKNNIPVFSPAIIDGAMGDLMHFQKQRYKDFNLDIVGEMSKIVKFIFNQEKMGAIILGGGSSKHFVLNAASFKDGLDYAVYITTAQEFDASDSGGNQQEAMTWAKLKVNAPNVKVKVEASIAFPLLVAATFAKRKNEYK